ncbi:MAG: hypothetical protein QOF96_3232 [Actinomycetota bacterium]|nr:hypothetical protein [Actinomycetota bacterium]
MFTGIPAAAQPGGRAVIWALRLLVAGGVVAIAVAWSEASNTVRVSDQVDWAPLGLAGVALVTVSLLGSVLVARQAVAIRLSHLAPSIAGPEAWALATAPAAAVGMAESRIGAAPAGVGGEPLVAGASMARYHRASCPLTAGKPVRPESRSAHERAGRRACGVCAP